MNGDLSSQELDQLKSLFLQELSTGYTEAERALERLAENPADAEAWDVIKRFFHRLAGTASPVGFPLLGRLGAACEGLCDLVSEGSLGPARSARVLNEGLGGVSEVLREVAGRQLRRARTTVPEQGADGGTGKVLVVDDDPVGAKVTVDTLRRAGFASVHVADATRALDVIFLEGPDLIILDVVMPGLDGFELCRRLRSNPALALIPVIFLTRRDDVSQRVKGLEVGGNDYIAKPFEPEELVARVRSHLGRLATLREMAIRDGLTRCYNHEYFKSRLDQELARARRYRSGLAVALIDIDFFKKVNDQYGHAAGDAVLAHLSSLVAASVRSTDVVARYGGEEFGLLLIQSGAAEANIIMSRMRHRVESHRFALSTAREGPFLNVTVSVGIAEAQEQDTPQTLLVRADQALYSAKEKGRNRVELADSVPAL